MKKDRLNTYEEIIVCMQGLRSGRTLEWRSECKWVDSSCTIPDFARYMYRVKKVKQKLKVGDPVVGRYTGNSAWQEHLELRGKVDGRFVTVNRTGDYFVYAEVQPAKKDVVLYGWVHKDNILPNCEGTEYVPVHVSVPED